MGALSQQTKPTSIATPKQKKITRVDLVGNVRMHEKDRILVGDKTTLLLNNKEATVHNARYRYTAGKQPLLEEKEIFYKKIPKNSIRVKALSVWGKAKTIHKHPNDILTLKKATLSTCPPGKSFWHLSASDVTLNKISGRGTAKHVTMFVKKYACCLFSLFQFPYRQAPQNWLFISNLRHI